ncbi:unnamed protein product [Didymodactylos carnosus]|uniref:Uncharacterized protein n=1 Tax=Didymodactylos carnosus TaxID=1234261 RepID=A0A815WEZ5_9BILA|nr:unnamed protein product [Didymodactylos carnosus]CAF4405061.1 unnamed protein product [Didymodactylos carnosus]
MLKKNLKRLKNLHTNKLILELKDVETINITTDFWSNRSNQSFMVLTDHYYSNDLDLKSTILHYSSFSQSHTARNIANAIKSKLQELRIYHKIHCIVCDGAPNMLKIFSYLDPEIKRIWCIAHRLHLIICNGPDLWDKAKSFPPPTAPSTLTTTNSSQQQLDTEASDDDDEIEGIADSDIDMNSSVDVDSQQVSNFNDDDDQNVKMLTKINKKKKVNHWVMKHRTLKI